VGFARLESLTRHPKVGYEFPTALKDVLQAALHGGIWIVCREGGNNHFVLTMLIADAILQ
jgi:hypothetical protein